MLDVGRPVTFKEAVEDACIIAWVDFNKEDPEGTLNSLIDWHCAVALDPAVSSEARRLQRDAQLSLIKRMNLIGWIDQSGVFYLKEEIDEIVSTANMTPLYALPSRIDK